MVHKCTCKHGLTLSSRAGLVSNAPSAVNPPLQLQNVQPNGPHLLATVDSSWLGFVARLFLGRGLEEFSCASPASRLFRNSRADGHGSFNFVSSVDETGTQLLAEWIIDGWLGESPGGILVTCWLSILEALMEAVEQWAWTLGLVPGRGWGASALRGPGRLCETWT